MRFFLAVIYYPLEKKTPYINDDGPYIRFAQIYRVPTCKRRDCYKHRILNIKSQ